MADLSKETATVVFRAVAFVLFAGNFFVVCLISSSIGFFFFFFFIIIILGAQPVPSVGNLLSARLQRRLFPTMKRSSSVCLYPGSFSLCSPSFFLFFRKIRKEMKSTKRRRAKSTSYIREESGGIVEQ